jgi:hypothetical protein
MVIGDEETVPRLQKLLLQVVYHVLRNYVILWLIICMLLILLSKACLSWLCSLLQLTRVWWCNHWSTRWGYIVCSSGYRSYSIRTHSSFHVSLDRDSLSYYSSSRQVSWRWAHLILLGLIIRVDFMHRWVLLVMMIRPLRLDVRLDNRDSLRSYTPWLHDDSWRLLINNNLCILILLLFLLHNSLREGQNSTYFSPIIGCVCNFRSHAGDTRRIRLDSSSTNHGGTSRTTSINSVCHSNWWS